MVTTSYVSIVDNKAECTLRDYLLRCARGMGACVLQRDEPLDSQPRYISSDVEYCEKELAKAEAELERLLSLSKQQRAEEFERHVVLEKNRRAACEQEQNEALARRKRMLALVRAWVPPTPEHGGLKDFAIGQILECGVDYEEPYYKSTLADSENEFLAQQIAEAQKLIASCKSYLAKAQKSAAERKAWIETLYEALQETA